MLWLFEPCHHVSAKARPHPPLWYRKLSCQPLESGLASTTVLAGCSIHLPRIRYDPTCRQKMFYRSLIGVVYGPRSISLRIFGFASTSNKKKCLLDTLKVHSVLSEPGQQLGCHLILSGRFPNQISLPRNRVAAHVSPVEPQ